MSEFSTSLDVVQQEPPPHQPSKSKRNSGRVLGWLGAIAPALGMVFVVIVLVILKPEIATGANVQNILIQSAGLAILATGFAIAFMVKGIDLSVAQVADAAGLIVAFILVRGPSVAVALTVALAFALVVGIVNGVLSAYLGVPALIVTLGMMFIVRSLELVLTNGREPQILFDLPPAQTDPLFFLGQGSIGPISVPVLIAVGVVLIGHLVTTRTTLGRAWEAIEGNVRAAYLAGVRHRLVYAVGFVFSALFAAVAGIVLTARASLAAPGALEPMLLEGFVAVYLGSLLSRAGRITVVGAAIGALFVGVIGNALTLLGAGAAVRYIAYGAIILISMTIGAIRRR